MEHFWNGFVRGFARGGSQALIMGMPYALGYSLGTLGATPVVAVVAILAGIAVPVAWRMYRDTYIEATCLAMGGRERDEHSR